MIIKPAFAQVTLPSDPISTKFPSIGSLVTQILPYVYVFAGLGLLIMLIVGGVELMTSTGDPGKTKAAYGRITSALIGFVLVFATYMIAQIIEVALGVKIL